MWWVIRVVVGGRYALSDPYGLFDGAKVRGVKAEQWETGCWGYTTCIALVCSSWGSGGSGLSFRVPGGSRSVLGLLG